VKKAENLNLINFNLLNFNLDNFNAYDLQIEMKQQLTDYNLLAVTGFSGSEGVVRYAQRVRESVTEVMGEIPPGDYEIVIISGENYTRLLESKEFVPYLLFYRQNYSE
jgi:hypothetical protein